MADKDPRAEFLLKRWRALSEGRSAYMQHCEDLSRVLVPARSGFITQTHDGDRRGEDICDGTGMQAARSLANAVDGMLWPEGQQSFFIETADDDIKDDDEVRFWLSDCESRMEDAFDNPRARFRQSRGEANIDLVALGGAHIFMGEGASLNHLLFQTLHPRDALPVFDDEGNPNGMFMSRRFTLRQAIEKFGEDSFAPDTRKKIDESKQNPALLDKPMDFLHCVVKRREAPPGAMLAKNLPYASIWIEIECCYIVSESGFHEYPFACPRWDTSSGETNGRSPGMVALPDVNTLQAQEETLLIAGQRLASPPLLVPSDSAFDAANTVPDGITYYDAALAREIGRIPIVPLETGANLPIVMEMQEAKRNQVWAAFLRNILNLPIDGPQMTATEIIQRREEIIREVGPVFGRFETDYKAPTVERPFMVMLRAGAFLPIPEQLQGRAIKFRYSSPIKKIRQQIEAAAARAFALERGELVKMTGDPSHMDIVDLDALGQVEAEAGNVPNAVVRSREKIAQIRQQREQAAQAAAQAQMAQTMADAANKGSQAIKNLRPEQAAA